MKKTLLIDNSSFNYLNQLKNGVPIRPFYSIEENPNDIELKKLCAYLKYLSNFEDLAEENSRYFSLDLIDSAEDIDEALLDILDV